MKSDKNIIIKNMAEAEAQDYLEISPDNPFEHKSLTFHICLGLLITLITIGLFTGIVIFLK